MLRRGHANPQIIERIQTDIFRALADSLNLPLFAATTNSDSIKKDLQGLLMLVNQKYGVHSVVLNMFEQDTLKSALQKHYEDAGIEVLNFLRDRKPEEIFLSALESGFKAHILSVNEKYLNRSYLGMELTPSMLQTFQESNMHPFGINGEFETICVDGPNFKHKIPLNFGDIHFKNGSWYREISLVNL